MCPDLDEPEKWFLNGSNLMEALDGTLDITCYIRNSKEFALLSAPLRACIFYGQLPKLLVVEQTRKPSLPVHAVH